MRRAVRGVMLRGNTYQQVDQLGGAVPGRRVGPNRLILAGAEASTLPQLRAAPGGGSLANPLPEEA